MNAANMFRALTQLFSLRADPRTLLTRTPDFTVGKPKQNPNPMNLNKKMILALGVLAVAGAGYAQSPNEAVTGTLGQRFVDVSYGLQDVRRIGDNIQDADLAFNAPLTPFVDVGVSYGYAWGRGALRGHSNTLGTAATYYGTLQGVKPFATVGLAYRWDRFLGGRDNYGLWGAGAGVEIPVSRGFTVTPGVSYADDFEGGDSRDFTYSVEANYWVSRTSAVYGSIARTDAHRSPFDVWHYDIGLRFRF